MSRIPYFVDNRLTDCGEVVNLTRRPHFNLEGNSTISFLFIIIIPVGSLRALKKATEHFLSSSALYRLSFVQTRVSSTKERGEEEAG
jgi:hypothetical protein